MHEKKLSSLQTLLPILEAVVQSGKPLLIGCPSVAELLITTEAMVGDKPEPKGVAGMPPSGMGGMGGMDRNGRNADTSPASNQIIG